MQPESIWQRLFKKLVQKPLRRKEAGVSTRLMEVETLEDRRVPASIFVASFADGAVGATVSLAGGDFRSDNLRTAVNFANMHAGADTIKLNTGTYDLNTGYGGGGQLDITTLLTIKNKFGGPSFSTIDAHDGSRIFNISNSGD